MAGAETTFSPNSTSLAANHSAIDLPSAEDSGFASSTSTLPGRFAVKPISDANSASSQKSEV